MVSVACKLAVHAMDVSLAVKLSDGKCAFVREAMAAVNGDHHLFAKQRDRMQALVGLFARQRIDDEIEVAGEKSLAQFPGTRVAKFELDAGMTSLDAGDQIDDFAGEIVLMMPSLSGTLVLKKSCDRRFTACD